MKRCLFTIGALALLMMTEVGCRKADIRTGLIDVPQMRGEPCANIVRHVLFRLPGVDREKTEVDLVRRRVIVVYDSMILSLKNLEHALADIGLTANNVPGNEDAMSKLPAACRAVAASAASADAADESRPSAPRLPDEPAD
jgi:copper chaperone CopZ